jgi:hypothetical protein
MLTLEDSIPPKEAHKINFVLDHTLCILGDHSSIFLASMWKRVDLIPWKILHIENMLSIRIKNSTVSSFYKDIHGMKTCVASITVHLSTVGSKKC